jgi:threonine dehydrogenase-like Zn-dependent dehydrogenase
VPERLKKAASIGAIPIDFTKSDPVKQIMDLEPNGVTRSCDCVGFECVNDKLQPDEGIIIQKAVAITAADGGIGVIGTYFAEQRSKGTPLAQGNRAANISFPISEFFIKNHSMQSGAVDSKVFAPTLLGLIERGKAHPSFIFTDQINLEQAQQGYLRFSEQKDIKISIRFPYEEAEGMEDDSGIEVIDWRLEGA